MNAGRSLPNTDEVGVFSPSTGANQTDMVRIFISYAHDDAPIAQALHEALLEVNRDRVECFLDTEAIESGRNFEQEINEFLSNADWLVCIYTGQQSDYCGYEVGVFSNTRINMRRSDSRLVCLYHTPEFPSIFRNHRNHKVILPPKRSKAVDIFDEEEFYRSSPLAGFFGNIYSYKGLYNARNSSEAQRQTRDLIKHTKSVTEAFIAVTSDEVRADTPTQLLIEVTIPPPKMYPLNEMPENSTVTGTFASLRVFGLMPPMENRQLPVTTWGRLREVVTRPGAGHPLWLLNLERDMLNAANGLALNGASASFLSSDTVYRPILARHRLYEGGANKFDILFVETLPRQFLGRKITSILLSSIVMASRFRFAYFERPAEIAAAFDDRVPTRDFEARCKQLLYDIERLEHELVEFGVDEISFLTAFGEDNKALAEEFIKTWKDATDRLYRVLPAKFGSIDETKRPSIRDAVIEFLTSVEAENSRFLLTAINLYRDELENQLRS